MVNIRTRTDPLVQSLSLKGISTPKKLQNSLQFALIEEPDSSELSSELSDPDSDNDSVSENDEIRIKSSIPQEPTSNRSQRRLYTNETAQRPVTTQPDRARRPQRNTFTALTGRRKKEPLMTASPPSVDFTVPSLRGKSICYLCGKGRNGADVLVSCESCQKWFHGCCKKVPLETPNQYFCDSCKPPPKIKRTRKTPAAVNEDKVNNDNKSLPEKNSTPIPSSRPTTLTLPTMPNLPIPNPPATPTLSTTSTLPVTPTLPVNLLQPQSSPADTTNPPSLAADDDSDQDEICVLCDGECTCGMAALSDTSPMSSMNENVYIEQSNPITRRNGRAVTIKSIPSPENRRLSMRLRGLNEISQTSSIARPTKLCKVGVASSGCGVLAANEEVSGYTSSTERKAEIESSSKKSKSSTMEEKSVEKNNIKKGEPYLPTQVVTRLEPGFEENEEVTPASRKNRKGVRGKGRGGRGNNGGAGVATERDKNRTSSESTESIEMAEETTEEIMIDEEVSVDILNAFSEDMMDDDELSTTSSSPESYEDDSDDSDEISEDIRRLFAEEDCRARFSGLFDEEDGEEDEEEEDFFPKCWPSSDDDETADSQCEGLYDELRVTEFSDILEKTSENICQAQVPLVNTNLLAPGLTNFVFTQQQLQEALLNVGTEMNGVVKASTTEQNGIPAQSVDSSTVQSSLPVSATGVSPPISIPITANPTLLSTIPQPQSSIVLTTNDFQQLKSFVPSSTSIPTIGLGVYTNLVIPGITPQVSLNGHKPIAATTTTTRQILPKLAPAGPTITPTILSGFKSTITTGNVAGKGDSTNLSSVGAGSAITPLAARKRKTDDRARGSRKRRGPTTKILIHPMPSGSMFAIPPLSPLEEHSPPGNPEPEPTPIPMEDIVDTKELDLPEGLSLSPDSSIHSSSRHLKDLARWQKVPINVWQSRRPSGSSMPATPALKETNSDSIKITMLGDSRRSTNNHSTHTSFMKTCIVAAVADILNGSPVLTNTSAPPTSVLNAPSGSDSTDDIETPFYIPAAAAAAAVAVHHSAAMHAAAHEAEMNQPPSSACTSPLCSPLFSARQGGMHVPDLSLDDELWSGRPIVTANLLGIRSVLKK